MSIYFSGTFKRSSGLISAITKQLKFINLKPVKKIDVKFDPFHPQAKTARDFLFHITSPSITSTNVNCAVKTNIVCDRSDPIIQIELLEKGNIVKFLADNLTVLEILQQFNKHISSLVKPEELAAPSSQVTKLDKKKSTNKSKRR